MIVITGIGLAFCFFEGRLFLRFGLFDPPLFLCPKLFLLFCLRLLAGLPFRLFWFLFDPRLLIDLGLIFDIEINILLYEFQYSCQRKSASTLKIEVPFVVGRSIVP